MSRILHIRKFATKANEKQLHRTTSSSWPADLSQSLTGSRDGKQKFNHLESGLDILKREAVLDEYLRGILAAQTVIYDVCRETDLQYAPTLSARLKNHVYLKREDQQPVYSFKLRGAYNKIASLPQDRLDKGIVACSAGNHAQGVALSAKRLGIDAVIVMPKATPSIKVDAVRGHGGNVLLFGENYDEAQGEAIRLASEGRTLIHPFDDPYVICGQGTIGMEILKQMPHEHKRNFHGIFCTVGGGGLLAGVSTYIKKVSPSVRMIGVEAKDAPGMTVSLEKGEIVSLDAVGLFADGAAVKTVGKNTFELIKELSDGMVTCTTDEICAAIKAGFNDTRSILEPAGALAIAGLTKYVTQTGITGQTLVAVASGANMDFDRLRFVSERADSFESLIAVTMPERPGVFWDLYSKIYPRNVTEFSYRYDPNNNGMANVVFAFQAKTPVDKTEVLEKISSSDGYTVYDMVDNELGKGHIRYLAGGRALKCNEERLFRFEFPEKPGALYHFLEKLTGHDARKIPFNVTLFHYRNHGADIGRVLVGIQQTDQKTIDELLDSLGFLYTEETENTVYKNFLVNQQN